MIYAGAAPLILAIGHPIFHTSDATIEMIEAMFQTLESQPARVDVGVIKLSFARAFERHDRLGFHHHSGQQIQAANRPKTGEDKKQDGQHTRPEE